MPCQDEVIGTGFTLLPETIKEKKSETMVFKKLKKLAMIDSGIKRLETNEVSFAVASVYCTDSQATGQEGGAQVEPEKPFELKDGANN